MKACAEKSLGACYNDIFPGLDVAGLCASQCDGSKTEKELAQSGFREGCRLCEVFMCCETCPAERAGECFPSTTEEGNTPPNWEPATCASSGNNRMIGSISLMAFIIWALV